MDVIVFVCLSFYNGWYTVLTKGHFVNLEHQDAFFTFYILTCRKGILLLFFPEMNEPGQGCCSLLCLFTVGYLVGIADKFSSSFTSCFPSSTTLAASPGFTSTLKAPGDGPCQGKKNPMQIYVPLRWGNSLCFTQVLLDSEYLLG